MDPSLIEHKNEPIIFIVLGPILHFCDTVSTHCVFVHNTEYVCSFVKECISVLNVRMFTESIHWNNYIFIMLIVRVLRIYKPTTQTNNQKKKTHKATCVLPMLKHSFFAIISSKHAINCL